jgi:hypothetical protein
MLPSAAAAEAAILTITARKKQLARRCAELYDYDLLRRNCVTRLLAELDQALSSKPDAIAPVERPAADPATQRLHRALASTSAIPWRMFQQLQERLPEARTNFYPSFRQRRLDALYRQQNDLQVYARECNILTSTIYRQGGRDDNFLFFTDDAGPLRPLFGAANLAWSLPQTAFGLLSWPFDAGQRLENGLSGALFSLPELLFINLRKGSFVRTKD